MNCSASRRTSGRRSGAPRGARGFSLVEVLLACALLALALVPLMRAAGRNRAAAEALRGLAGRIISENDASAREAAEASVTNNPSSGPSGR